MSRERLGEQIRYQSAKRLPFAALEALEIRKNRFIDINCRPHDA
jgi:hypothetical protein